MKSKKYLLSIENIVLSLLFIGFTSSSIASLPVDQRPRLDDDQWIRISHHDHEEENHSHEERPADEKVIAEYIQAEFIGLDSFGRAKIIDPVTGESVTVDINDPEISFLNEEGVLAEYEADIEIVAVPNFYFPTYRTRLSGQGGSRSVGKLKSWKECSGSIKGRYAGASRCTSRARVVHSSLYDVLMKMPSIAGGKSIYLVHHGITGDRNHRKRRSLHNSFRAIDVSEVKVNGKIYRYRTAVRNSKSAERRFYNKLIKNWESAVRKRCGGVVNATTINWTDKKHRSHLHLGTTYNCR